MTELTSAAERRRLASSYVAEVRNMFSPVASRGLADEAVGAPDLLPASRDLTAAARSGLRAADPLDVSASEVQLLAGAALDLLVAGIEGPGEMGMAARGVAAEPALDLAELQTIIDAPEAYLVGSSAGRSFGPIPAPRTRALTGPSTGMADATHAALRGIRQDVIGTGSHVVEGLLLLDAALLREAVSLVGGDVAKKLKIDLSGASARAVQFVLSANEKILSLVGLDAMSAARKQLNAWLEQLRKGTLFPELAERVLRTRAIEKEVDGWLTGYNGPEDPLTAGRDEINRLAGQFAAKMRVADKVTSGLALVKVLPPLMTPVGRIAVAAVHLGLLAYVVGSGYDHVDSDRIKLLNRVEGVRGVSHRVLVAGKDG